MAPGLRRRWTYSGWGWLVGLMATAAVAATEGGEFVVDAEYVTISRAPDPNVLDPAAFLLTRGNACETSEPDHETPWWSCRIHGQTLSGYAPRAAFRPRTGEVEPRPIHEWSLEDRFSRALTEKDRKRRDRLLVDGTLEAFNLEAGQCVAGSVSSCDDAIARRLMLYWTARGLESPSPSRPRKTLACSEGETVDQCLERALGSGTLGIGAPSRPDRFTFVYVLPQPPRAVRFVIGEFPSLPGPPGQKLPAYQAELHAEDSQEDPLLLEILRTSGVRRAYFSPGQPLEAERYVQNVGGSRTFVTNRPLDKGFFAICDNETRKIERPKLVRVAVGMTQYDNVLYPEYHYALPCKASFVLDGAIPGLRAGKRGPARTCPVVTKEWKGVLTLHVDPVTGDCRPELRDVNDSSRIVFSGDLNDDGQSDFIFFRVGDMGCGGPSLYLSSPQGWFQAGSSNHYC